MKRKTLVIGAIASLLAGVLIFDIFRDARLLWLALVFPFALLLCRISVKACLLWGGAFTLGLLRVFLALHVPIPTEVAFYAHAEKTKEESVISGTIANYPEKEFHRTKVYLAVEKIKTTAAAPEKVVSGKILVNLPRYPEVRYGEKIEVFGALQIPPEWEDFSYRRFLEKEGIFAYVPRASFHKLEGGNGNPVFKTLFTWRKNIEEILKQRLPTPEDAFARGILLGGEEGFSEQILEEFRRTGLSHLLALSGFNITILILFVFWVLKLLPKQWKIAGTILFISGFVLMTGASASVIRAAVMGFLGLLVLHSGQDTDPLYILLWSMGIIVLMNPFLLYSDVSFQLSVAGVLGLIIFTPLWEKWFARLPNFLGFKEGLQTTLAAQVMSFPLLALYFQRISLIAPLANLLVAPLIPLAMLFSALTLIPFIGTFFGFYAFGILKLALFLTHILAQIPFADVPFTIGNSWLLLWYAIFAFLIFKMQKKAF